MKNFGKIVEWSNGVKEKTTEKKVLSEKISNFCDELKKSLLTKPTEALEKKGIDTARKLETEFVDVIAIKLLTLKTYLQEVKKYLVDNTIDREEITDLVTNAKDLVSTVETVSKKDASFFELLAMPGIEIKNMIKEIKENLKVKIEMVA